MAYVFKPFEKAVGAFITIGLGVLILAGVILYRKSGAALARHSYYAVYDRGDSMKKDMDIYYNGFVIGKSTRISLLDDDRIQVSFYVERAYTNRLRTDSVAFLHQGLMGNSISILKGSSTSLFAETGSRLWSSDDAEGRTILADLHKKIYAPDRIDNIVVSLETLLNAIDAIAKEDGMLMNLITTANQILYQIDSNEGSIGAILGDEKQLFNSLNSSLSNLDSLLFNLGKVSQKLDDKGVLGIMGKGKK